MHKASLDSLMPNVENSPYDFPAPLKSKIANEKPNQLKIIIKFIIIFYY